jgi:hypothetical protein
MKCKTWRNWANNCGVERAPKKIRICREYLQSWNRITGLTAREAIRSIEKILLFSRRGRGGHSTAAVGGEVVGGVRRRRACGGRAVEELDRRLPEVESGGTKSNDKSPTSTSPDQPSPAQPNPPVPQTHSTDKKRDGNAPVNVIDRHGPWC